MSGFRSMFGARGQAVSLILRKRFFYARISASFHVTPHGGRLRRPYRSGQASREGGNAAARCTVLRRRTR